MPMFWLVMTLSGVLGLAISFTSMWFLHQTGATTYRYAKMLSLAISFFISSRLCASTLSLDALMFTNIDEYMTTSFMRLNFSYWSNQCSWVYLDSIRVHLLSVLCMRHLEVVLLLCLLYKKKNSQIRDWYGKKRTRPRMCYVVFGETLLT